MTQYLFTRRRRYVSPFRLLEAIAPLLLEAVDLLDGLGVQTGDRRWTEEAVRLRRARDALLKPAAATKKLLEAARAVARSDELLANLEKNQALADLLKSRKPMAWLKPAEPPVLLDKTHRKTMAWIRPLAIAAKVSRRRRGR